ncbi:hypothetical protein AC578_4192 [Pseudocercospora eumusae]|uniref:Uncharacterized protein n=1 Tax=Pseudocercospora eumusae TaxID=321146 RepID=A0A139HJD2_9PEZI|nr:hypothetical protein AC578_4192 [Pseudocercospora eumusae]
MARRSQRISDTPAQLARHKRAASGSGLTGSEPKRSRQASKAANATPTKSQYFQADDSQQDDTDEDKAASSPDAHDLSESDFDDDNSPAEESPGDEDSDTEHEDSANGRHAKNRTSVRTKNDAGWKTTGLEPGVEVIQKKPKARPAGKVAYANETIHPNTLLFLKDLKANNRREWLKRTFFDLVALPWTRGRRERHPEGSADDHTTIPLPDSAGVDWTLPIALRWLLSPGLQQSHRAAMTAASHLRVAYSGLHVASKGADMTLPRIASASQVGNTHKLAKYAVEHHWNGSHEVPLSFARKNAEALLSPLARSWDQTRSNDLLCYLNDPEFRQAEKDFHSFVEAMTEKLTEIDESIPELPVKDIFRIYRGEYLTSQANCTVHEMLTQVFTLDVRFSKDPTPYKASQSFALTQPYFSVAWCATTLSLCVQKLNDHRSRAGRKGTYAHYYIQIAPGDSLIGGGLWCPEAAPTRLMRRAIDRHPRRLKDVLLHDNIRREFLAGAAKSDKAVVKEFVRSNAENALKTRPKDYDANHPDIALLRLKNYTMIRKLADDEVLGETGFRRIAQLMETLAPWITYCNSVVMPDEASEEDDENEAEHEGEDEDSEE